MLKFITDRDKYSNKDNLELICPLVWRNRNILTCKMALFNEAPPVAKILVSGPFIEREFKLTITIKNVIKLSHET